MSVRSWAILGGAVGVLGVGLAVVASLRAPEPRTSVPVAPAHRATGSVAGARSGLVMPAPKKCLAGPMDVEGDHGMASSEGLAQDQVSASMRGFVPRVLPCVSDSGASPSSPLLLSITVACSGVVEKVEVADRGDWPGEVASCVADTLRYAPFPAHDLPDGQTFEYPLSYHAP